MKKIIKLRVGDPIPNNAVFLQCKNEPNHGKSRTEWRDSSGIRGFFGYETLWRITPVETFFYYEVEETNETVYMELNRKRIASRVR